MTAVIFDLDGTLIDSRAVMEAAFRAAYRQEVGSEEPPLVEFFGLLGESFPRILHRLGLPLSMCEPFYVESRARIGELAVHQGVVNVCNRLRQMGIQVGLLTGKDRERTLEILERFSLGDHFAAVATGSDGFQPKPAPDGVVLLCRELGTRPETTAVVGDGAFDMLAAKRAGALAVGCTWGMATGDALMSAQADLVVDDAHQLSDTLSHWLDGLPCQVRSRRPASSTAPWQVAVVGLGWIAERVHLPYLASTKDTRVVAAFDIHERRAIELCERFHIARMTRLDEILDSPAEVIVICTPPRTHVGLILAALAAGKHVICEKPLATSAADMREILVAAEQACRHVFCCMTNRFREDVATMRSKIQTGAIGEPRFARATWVRADGIPGSFGALESGVLWDLGAHMIDSLLSVTAWTRPVEVRSFGLRVSGSTRTEPANWYRNAVPQDILDEVADTAMLDVRFASGQAARVDVSWSAEVPDDRTEFIISGTEGALRLRTVFGWSDSRSRVREPALAIADRRRRLWLPLVVQERGQREYRAQLEYFFSKLAVAPSKAAWEELPIETIEILEQAEHATDARHSTPPLVVSG